MKKNQASFIEFALDYKVLQFGDFTLKSGRKSPYFFNAGLFQDGPALRTLGQFYADLYIEKQLTTPHLFGPAYKGILLATATAVALAEKNISRTVTFNRKEAKDHGEGGVLIGAPLNGPTTIIDDVVTKGTAFHEAKNLIETNHGQVDSVLIALDRCERGNDNLSTLQEIQKQGIAVYSIITVFDIMEYLSKHQKTREAELIQHYQKEYAPYA